MSATELPKLEELFIAGAQLSNCAFNLAQDDRLDDRVRKSLGECQIRWNAAFGERTSLRLALQANVDLAAESERLRAELGFVLDNLQEARDSTESWASYAGDYFIKKHRLAEELAEYDSAITKGRAALAAKDSP